MSTNEEQPHQIPIDGVLDLHTFSPKEIGDLVPSYLASCQEIGILEVRIIHGKGIGNLQRTVDLNTGEPTSIAVGGRHDTCIVPRAAAVAESMTAIVLADFAIRAGKIARVLR